MRIRSLMAMTAAALAALACISANAQDKSKPTQEAPVCACDVVDGFALSQPTISHHLRILREAGLVTVEKRGVWAWYTPDARGLVWFREMVARLGAPDAETARVDEEARLAAAG